MNSSAESESLSHDYKGSAADITVDLNGLDELNGSAESESLSHDYKGSATDTSVNQYGLDDLNGSAESLSHDYKGSAADTSVNLDSEGTAESESQSPRYTRRNNEKSGRRKRDSFIPPKESDED